MDEAGVEAGCQTARLRSGRDPGRQLEAGLRALDGQDRHKLRQLGVRGGVAADAKKPMSSLYLGQGGLGMPDRDYYLTDGFKDKNAGYQAYIARTFR